MSAITIRPAVHEDIAAVTELTSSLADETEGKSLSRKKVEKGIRAILEDSANGTILVAEVSGAVVGYILISGPEWSQWHCGRIFWLTSGFVKVEHRSNGIGRKLFKRAVNLAKARGAVGVRGYAMLDNTLSIAKQLRYGMKMTGYVVLEKLID
jgi:predicted N-acetyltransferase YhbS